MRDGVELPANLPRANVKSTNVAGQRGQLLCNPAAADQQIFVDGARTRHGDKETLSVVTQALAQVDSPVIPKAWIEFSCFCIHGIEVLLNGEKDSRLLPIGPIADSAIAQVAPHLLALKRVEHPQPLATDSVESEEADPTANEINHA